MEFTEPRGILDKMVTNETLAKVTRGSHFNPKPPSNGFRMPSSHLNGKTMPGLYHTTGSKSNPEQPRRSVIKLPGPPVNSSGAGGAFKTKSGNPDEKSLRGRSRKRLREGDPLLDAGSNHDDRKDGCEQSTSASETVEPTRRKRRGQSSKRAEKRGGHAPAVDAPVSKLRSSSSTAVPGILDIYGLKSRPVDVSRFMPDVPLDRLLSESLDRSRACENETGDECRLVIEEISNVMQLLPKHSIVQRPFVENGPSEDAKVRLMLDLERPLQAEESQQGEDRQEMVASLDKARSKSLELFPTFRLEDLPLYTADDFMDRLKLPANDSLETLISYSKPTDPAGSTTEKSSRFEGIPPSPFSFPVRLEPPRNGKTQWIKDGHLPKAKSDPTPMKTDGSEQSDGKGQDSRSTVRPKEEQADDKADVQREHERGKEKSRLSGCSEISKKIFPLHPDLPSLQLKRDEGETSQIRRSLSFPAMPCSPGAQAATILCNMANSDEKEFPPKGKQQVKEEGQTQKTVKLGRVAEERDVSRRESSGQQQQQQVKKSPVSEKKRSLSQVNHSLASVSKRLSTPDSARSSSSGHGFNKSDDHRHHHQQQQQQHHHHPREGGAAAKQSSSSSAAAAAAAASASAARVKDSNHHRDGKLLNGVLSLGVSKNPSSGKSSVASRRESSSLSRSQHSLAKTKTKLR